MSHVIYCLINDTDWNNEELLAITENLENAKLLYKEMSKNPEYNQLDLRELMLNEKGLKVDETTIFSNYKDMLDKEQLKEAAIQAIKQTYAYKYASEEDKAQMIGGALNG